MHMLLVVDKTLVLASGNVKGPWKSSDIEPELEASLVAKYKKYKSRVEI